MKPTNIRTVAREAGVSVATVSRVINRPELVAAETSERVLRIIQNLDFRVSKKAQLAGRRVRSSLTNRIGFLAPANVNRTTESITEEMHQGILKVLSPRGIELVVDYYQPDSKNALPLPRMLRENSVDGVLLRPPGHRATVIECCRNRKAVILGNTFADLDFPCVITDDWAGMRMVMNYLFELGHRRIAHFGGSMESLLYLRRFHSYRAFLEQHKIPYDARLVRLAESWVIGPEEAHVLAGHFLKELRALTSPPTAITATSDGFAVALMRSAREIGLRIPEDLSITGYGDLYYASLLDLPLTTVHIDQRAAGEFGATCLLQLIEGAPYSMQGLIQPTFVERRSCARISG